MKLVRMVGLGLVAYACFELVQCFRGRQAADPAKAKLPAKADKHHGSARAKVRAADAVPEVVHEIEGREVVAQDVDGASAVHRVGRGVITGS